MNTAAQIAEYMQFLMENGVQGSSNPDLPLESEGVLLDQLKLHCLLFYAQGHHLSMTGKPLFAEPIYAHAHGPCVESIPCPCPEAEPALESIYTYTKEGDIESAADTMLDFIADRCEAGCFEEVDYFIVAINLDWLDTNLLVGLLSFTYAYGHELKCRARLVERVESRLRELVPDRVENLMRGLRGVMDEKGRARHQQLVDLVNHGGKYAHGVGE